MQNHTELLNFLTQRYKLKSYLEIGVQNPDNNFNIINIETKRGCDPHVVAKFVTTATSDHFFEMFKAAKFDLIFIDGLHTEAQVKMDFLNSLVRLNRGGFIVIHDTNPQEEIWTKVPRESKQWTGDVYKFVSRLSEIEGIEFKTIDFDYGCTIVKRGRQHTKVRPLITWNYFDKNKMELLKLVTPEEMIVSSRQNKYDFFNNMKLIENELALEPIISDNKDYGTP